MPGLVQPRIISVVIKGIKIDVPTDARALDDPTEQILAALVLTIVEYDRVLDDHALLLAHLYPDLDALEILPDRVAEAARRIRAYVAQRATERAAQKNREKDN